MKKLLLFISLLLLTACGQQFNEQHVTYLENENWHIKEEVSVETLVLELPEEILSNYEASGVSFLRDYLGQEITMIIYYLDEKDTDGNQLKAVIYEIGGEVIGGYGVLPNWTPGVFSLDDKERLISESMISQ